MNVSSMDAAAKNEAHPTVVKSSPSTDAMHAANRRPRRRALVKWLRKIHMYLGLWGAIIGLLFGATGILMNHRSIMKIPLERSVQTSTQLALPASGFENATQMAEWLQKELKFTPAQAPQPRIQPAKKVKWAGQDVTQPERWAVNLNTPKTTISAEYFVGNQFIKVEQNEATMIGLLTRLHTASGATVFWVLLSDTIAGSLMLLALTGLLLWTQLHTIRTLTVLTSVGAVLATLAWMWTLP